MSRCRRDVLHCMFAIFRSHEDERDVFGGKIMLISRDLRKKADRLLPQASKNHFDIILFLREKIEIGNRLTSYIDIVSKACIISCSWL
jgi:hypothetical protein